MRQKFRFTLPIYLLCTLIIPVALGCRLLLPQPDLPPDQPILTSAPGEVFPTEAVQPTEPAPPQSTNVTVTRENQYYQITGSTEDELRQQMNLLGPPDEDTGKIFDARTDWYVKWQYYYDQSGNECKIDRAEVTLTLTFHYPEWNPPAEASKRVFDKWKSYMEKLITHEEGHASLAEVGAQSVYETIVALPASPTCEALGEAANAAAQEKMDELKQRQQAYDDETGHGKTQGAVFP